MHLCGRRAFLRTEYVRRALRTAERIVHVAGHVDARAGQPGVESMDIDGGDPRQRRRRAAGCVLRRPAAARSAVSMPAPASLVAEPPRPRMMWRAPASSAARISSPTPWLLARIGSRRAGAISSRPEAAAISMTAVPSASMPQTASTLWPSASFTVCMRASPEAAASTASTVPSPPSAMGTQTVCAPGIAAFTPRAMASAAAGAEMLSLNESGAMTIFTMRTSLVRIGGVHDTRALASRRTIAFPLFLAR